MTNDEAKRILALFRPDSADRMDPAFADALEKAKPQAPAVGHWDDKPDTELPNWFHAHCASYMSVRAKFQDIPVPPGLREQIIDKTPPNVGIVVGFRAATLWRIAAVLVLCAGLAAYFLHSPAYHQDDFSAYRERMAGTALQAYGMSLHSQDLQAIDKFLAGHGAPSGCVLPGGITKAQPVGCAIVRWRGAPVSLICFRSGKPLAAGAQADVWLFVTDTAAVLGSPAPGEPVVAPFASLTMATWVKDGKVYILAAKGGEAELRQYL